MSRKFVICEQMFKGKSGDEDLGIIKQLKKMDDKIDFINIEDLQKSELCNYDVILCRCAFKKECTLGDKNKACNKFPEYLNCKNKKIACFALPKADASLFDKYLGMLDEWFMSCGARFDTEYLIME
ncbi:hypothetical protein HNV12_15260 [Methanococcoides sp. SA1]|nr:hypothetical protein [Methanococcoides sp. SA1]